MDNNSDVLTFQTETFEDLFNLDLRLEAIGKSMACPATDDGCSASCSSVGCSATCKNCNPTATCKNC